ncbi:MAG: leucyl/phenylalanyl-tRNA--protein transferase [Myxococcota bacterium]
MPVYLLTEDLAFPPPEGASPDGIVAVGGDVSPERLVLAYSQGIFPWPVEGYPLLWFCPDPRFVLPMDELHVGRSLRKAIRRAPFELRFDTAFAEVMAACAKVPRPGQSGTWITPELEAGFTALHRMGYAHSVEAYDAEGALVGGLYGVSLGRAFFGESMFALRPDASKIAFATLGAQLRRWGFYFIDAQVHTPHLQRFGARDMDRGEFLTRLEDALAFAPRRGTWELELGAEDVVEALRDA